MRIRTVMALAALAVVAACAKPPLDEQQKTALADSIEQYVAGPFVATFEHPNVDAILALYAPGADIQVVENGSIYPTREAAVQGVRAMWGAPKLTAHFTLGGAKVAVLSRDAAVYSAHVTGGMKDSTGVETPLHFAWTGVFVRTGGGWKLQVEHWSSPPAPAPAAPAKPAHKRR
jgi:ketosteroid isomerase-like protein